VNEELSPRHEQRGDPGNNGIIVFHVLEHLHGNDSIDIIDRCTNHSRQRQ
jgi:hypothetical protein